MNNTDKKTENTVQIKTSTLYTIIAAIVVIIAVMIVIMISLVSSNKTTIAGKVTKLTGSKQTTAITTLNNAMEDFRTHSHMFELQDGNSQTTMLYNTHGESVAEEVDTGYKLFHLNTNEVISFSDTIGYTSDSDVISLLEQVLKHQAEKKWDVYKVNNPSNIDTSTGDTSAEDNNLEYYALDVSGWNDIQDIYRYVSDEFSDAMIESLKSSIAEIAKNEDAGISAEDKLNLRFMFVINEDKLYGGACYVYFGEHKPTEISNNELNLNWYFQDVFEMYDWELDPKWYSLDWNSMEEWTDTTEVEQLLISQYESILEVLDKFAEDNNVAPVEDETSMNNTVDNTDSENESNTENNTNSDTEVSTPEDLGNANETNSAGEEANS